jgi:glycosyltransferase involved in cell wall biosynthesis
MNSVKYSVLIPLFKTDAGLLKRCLDSVLNLGRNDLEIIVVEALDQGKSVFQQLGHTYAQSIRYFVADHSGISHQRNLCLQKASGDFLLFLDSDDYLLSNFLSLSDLCLSVDPQADLIVFNHTCNDRVLPVPFSANDLQICTDKNVMVQAFSSCNRGSFSFEEKSVWAKVFRHQVIDRGRFAFDESVLSSEDHLFMMSFISACSSVVFATKYAVYHYFISPSSISPRPYNNSPENYTNIMKAWGRLISDTPLGLHFKNSWSYNACCVYLPRTMAYYFCSKENAQNKKTSFFQFKAMVKSIYFAEAIKFGHYQWCSNPKKRFQLFLLKTHQFRLYFNLFWRIYH